MGATSKYPTPGGGGGTAPGFYQNAFDKAKQQVANVGQTQQAQAQPGQPPNRPSNGGGGDNALDAYNNYMAKNAPQGGGQPQQNIPSSPQPNYTAMFGGDGSSQSVASNQGQQPQPPQTTLRPQPAAGNPPQGPGNQQQDPRRQRPGQRPPQGINMGAGYSNRTFG
jgi:hypothetical protein